MRLLYDNPHGFGTTIGAGGPEGNAVRAANDGRSANSAAFSVVSVETTPPDSDADLIIDIDQPSDQMSQASIDAITAELQDRLGPDVTRR